ncbi:MAG TPA: DUF5916 domain-containing protein [Longimicrobium sp.]|jgi:hypothetical protein
MHPRNASAQPLAAALVLSLLLAAPLAAQVALGTGAAAPAHRPTHAGTAPTVRAVPAGEVKLDGALDDAAWAAAPAATDFRQQDPNEGQPATQRTEVRFAYGPDALYVGARMHDTLGAAGVRTRLARRDQDAGGDWLELVFDTYHDHAGRTVFRINPSGVKTDAGQASPSADPSWDPVWQAATRVDSAGWTAELRIPWSQLRFSRDSAQTWGVQIWRYVERLNEISMWSFWGKQENGGPAYFGHLQGLDVARRPGGWEVMPYMLARAAYVRSPQPGSPFHDASAYDVRTGADVKALLGSNLTLSATFNPDFGQVEVDPAVVNLSAFEVSFEEKRPFFVEGSGILGFGGLSCFTCSNVSSTNLFYSRRIGRRPQGGMPFRTTFSDVPENTPILGAAKLTGRLGNGLEIGVLEAVTGAEKARFIDAAGAEVEREVEPLTNYLVGRVRRTFRGGNATVGAIATSVARSFGYDTLRHQLSSHAEALGVDWNVYWNNRTYRLMGNVAVSSVAGDSLAILRLQRSSARYFQRPDREHGGNGLFSDAYDPSLTSMRGFAGYARLAREGGPLRWETQLNVRSPGFEVNDAAIITRADYVWTLVNVNRRWTTPTRWYRYLGITAGAQNQFNFDGDVNDRQVHLSLYADLPNYWGTGLYLQYRPEVFDERLTRGGAVVRRAASRFVGWNLNTDMRKPLALSTNPGYFWREDGGFEASANLGVRYRPTSNVSLTVSPSFFRLETPTQFVDAFADPSAVAFYGRRAVFGGLSQRTVSMDTRLNVTFSPTLSLELFAQPFVSTGEYHDFKEFAAPRAIAKTELGERLTPVVDAEGRETAYDLDSDGDGDADFRFRNPDFNFRSLRGNAVLRWEYRPGSTLFFVWQQQRSGSEAYGDFSFDRDASAVFRQHPDNVFVIKASYWLGR